MAALDFPEIYNILKEKVIEFAISEEKLYKYEAGSDAIKNLGYLKENLKNWVFLLEKHQINLYDFNFLLLGQKELLEMKELINVGVSKRKANELKIRILHQIYLTISEIINAQRMREPQ